MPDSHMNTVYVCIYAHAAAGHVGDVLEYLAASDLML